MAVASLAGGLLGGVALRNAKAAGPALLRPPGAEGEVEFLSACLRCGQCVEACPTDVLHLAAYDTGLAAGTPYVAARETPCNLCQGESEMKCIPSCPSGALKPIPRREDVRMGVAKIDTNTCLPYHGVICKACWHACPFPNDAIELDPRGRAVVVDDVCTGCGLCEHACLTDPTSIRVVPK